MSFASAEYDKLWASSSWAPQDLEIFVEVRSPRLPKTNAKTAAKPRQNRGRLQYVREIGRKPKIYVKQVAEAGKAHEVGLTPGAELTE